MVPKYDVHKGYQLLDHSTIQSELPFLEKLLPVGLDSISLEKHPQPILSSQLLKDADDFGFKVSHANFPLYSHTKFGTTRRSDNSDLIIGYPMYGRDSEASDVRVNHMIQMRASIAQFNKRLEEVTRAIDDRLWEDEEDDATRFNFQRVPLLGRHLQLPYSSNLKGVKYPKEFIRILDMVINHYAAMTKSSMPDRDAILRSSVDAVETAPGAPSFLPGGIDYNESRLTNLLVQPPVNYSEHPLDYLNKCYRMGRELGLPQGEYFFASYQSFRFGQKRKPLPIWYPTPSNWVQEYQAKSLYPNQRSVYPGSFGVNLIMNPAVYLMKSFRKRKLGMWHTPDLQMRYIPRLQKQGSVAYMSDFSNFDMTISNVLMRYISRQLARKTKFVWEFEFLDNYLDTTGVVYPNLITNEPANVTFIQGKVSLLSGWLITSEMGSIASIAANLFALSGAIPDVTERWIKGDFVMLVQSDDVAFTLPSKIDHEQFAERIESLGMKSKLQEGSMFLKQILPIGYMAKNGLKSAKPISRLEDNTWGNEQNYSHMPDFVLRLGLFGRAINVRNNPAWNVMRDDFLDQLKTSSVFSDDHTLTYFDQGIEKMDAKDVKDIIEWASSAGLGWLSKLQSRADSDPYAMKTLALLSEIGVNINQMNDELLSQRALYLQTLNKKVDAHAISQFFAAKSK
jgi:hypothetical protein